MKVRDPDVVIYLVELVKDDYPVWAMNMRTRLRGTNEIDYVKISLLDEFVPDPKDESRENLETTSSQLALYHHHSMDKIMQNLVPKAKKILRAH